MACFLLLRSEAASEPGGSFLAAAAGVRSEGTLGKEAFRGLGTRCRSCALALDLPQGFLVLRGEVLDLRFHLLHLAAQRVDGFVHFFLHRYLGSTLNFILYIFLIACFGTLSTSFLFCLEISSFLFFLIGADKHYFTLAFEDFLVLFR